MNDPELQTRMADARARHEAKAKIDRVIRRERDEKLLDIKHSVRERFGVFVEFEEHYGGPPGGISSYSVEPGIAAAREFIRAELERVGVSVEQKGRDVTHILF